jgi:hypothetical protein
MQADLKDQTFGRLTVIEPTHQRANNGNVVWRCRCSCGATTTAMAYQLTSGRKKSCGCLMRSLWKERQQSYEAEQKRARRTVRRRKILVEKTQSASKGPFEK